MNKKIAFSVLFVALVFTSCNQNSANQELLRDLSANQVREFGKILNALNKISETPFTEAIPKVIELAGSEKPKIRIAAVETLKAYGEIIIPDLAESLNSPNDNIKKSALELLMNIGKPALPAMKRVLKEGDSFTKVSVIGVLGSIGDKNVTIDLAKFLDSENPNLQIASATALGKLHADEVIGKLSRLLKSKNQLVKVAAVKALSDIGNPDMTDVIISNMKPNDDPEYLISAMETIEKIGRKRLKISWAMGTLYPIFCYKDADIRVRAKAAYLMYLCKYPDGIRIMERDILDGTYFKYPMYMVEIITAFKRVGNDPHITKTLTLLLKRYKNPFISAKIYDVLYSYGNKKYKDKILAVIDTKDPKTIEEGLKLAKEYKFKEVCKKLPELVKMPVFEIIFTAIETGGALQCASLIPWMQTVYGSDKFAYEIKEKILDVISLYPSDLAKDVLSKALKDNDPYIVFYAQKLLNNLQTSK
jgi:hypothetical protein